MTWYGFYVDTFQYTSTALAVFTDLGEGIEDVRRVEEAVGRCEKDQ
jgi:hypothetical protein